MNHLVNSSALKNFLSVALWALLLMGCGSETSPGQTCDSEECVAPPAALCQGQTLVAYADTGSCDDSGECAYEQTVTNCVAQDAQCVDGACVPNEIEDPCDGVVCDSPPDATCINSYTGVTYAEVGQCVGGVCQYETTNVDCMEREECVDGACIPVEDPCDEMECETPPGPTCDGNAVVTYSEAGECDFGECFYESTLTECGEDEVCSEGSCFAPTDSGLVITEIHYNPSTAQGDDADFEFLEIYNPGLSVNLAGYTFSSGVTHTFEDYTLAGGAYLVVAANAASYQGENVVAWTGGSLGNSGETITLLGADGEEVDTVTYENSGEWSPLANGDGYSLELINNDLDNNLAVSWRPSFIVGGTPGEANSSEPATMSASVGDIRINDFVGEYVITGGVVTGAFPDMNRFTIQDGNGAYSALWVEGVGAAYGEDVEVTGHVVDDGGRLMVWATAVEVVSPEGILPYAEPLTTLEAASDDWEAVLIEVTATCTQADLGYGEWGVDDGSGMLRVDDLGYVYETPIEGIAYTVRGPLDYSFSNFKIALRGEGDVELVDPCSVLSCDEPPVSICDGNSVLTYQATGTCTDGACFYESSAADCSNLECVATETGASCVADPCDAFDCTQPISICDGNSVVSYSGDGVCTGAEGCDFSAVETVTDCGDQECHGGVCYVVASASDLVITEYLANPASTDTNYEWFEVYNTLGTDLYVGGMVVSDAGSDSFTVLDGTIISAFDHYVFGQSADAIPGGPDYDWSESGTFLLANGDDEIILTYDSVVIDSIAYDDCSSCFPDPSGASVSLGGGSYAADNADSSLWCEGMGSYDSNGNQGTPGAENAICQVVDPCDGVTCEEPPAATCDGNTVVSYAAAGTCDGGVCAYENSETDCGDEATCTDGECVDNADPCAAVTCDEVPADYCTGDVATVFETGVCSEGVCSYASTDTDCSLTSQVCQQGSCVTETASYNIVINELYYNSPTSQGNDNLYEFLELYNAGETVNLEGCSFSAGVTHTFGSVTFEAGTYLVVTVNQSSYSSLSATVVEWTSGGLGNSGEEVTLVDPNGVVIDTVTYDDGNGWPAAADGAGASLELKDVTADNALSANWQASTIELGTPGAANSEEATVSSYTVYEINTTDVVGQIVSTQGVVTGVYSGSTDRFSISDGTGASTGLWIQGSDAVSVGDQVTVEGSVADSNGLLRVEAVSVQINSSNNGLPAALTLGTGAVLSPEYVGVLVQVVGSCDESDLGYGEWSIDDGTGSLRVDDLGFDYSIQAVGSTYQITAPLFYSYSNYKLVPRSAADVVSQ
ncbi:MAG: hypothetical protein HOK28_04155 [Deltaproteobacteria bacterium]|nr:hypothetical protein [Deltaproteobacteria bacterium]